MNQNLKVIKTYQKHFNDSFNVPPMLDEIKAELTFTPHIVFRRFVKMRLLTELLIAFAFIYMAYLESLYTNMDLNPSSEELRIYTLLGIAGLSFLLFLLDISHKFIKIRKKELKK